MLYDIDNFDLSDAMDKIRISTQSISRPWQLTHPSHYSLAHTVPSCLPWNRTKSQSLLFLNH